MANTAPETKRLLIPKQEAADLLGISYRTLHDLTKAGTIPCVRLGVRGVRYSVKALEQYIDRELARAAQ